MHQEKKDLYKMILHLPFLDSIDEVRETIESIMKSNHIDDNKKKYLEQKLLKKEQWMKVHIMKNFTAGIISTQRVESFHAQLKKQVNSNCQLMELVDICKNLMVSRY